MLDMILFVLLPFGMFVLGWFLGAKEKKRDDHGILLIGNDVNGEPHWTMDLHLTSEEIAKRKHLQLRVIERN